MSSATGGSFTSSTVTVRVCSIDSPPLSVVRTRIEYELLVSKSNTSVVLSVEPSSSNAALSSTSVNVCAGSPSGSAAVSVPTVVPVGSFSATSERDSVSPVGASLTSPIVTVSALANVAPAASVVASRIE